MGESERTMHDQELIKTLDELNAVVMRRFLSKKKQEKREKFYNAQIEKLRKKADKILEKENKKTS
jgi:type III secretory pathway component EscR